MASYNDEAQYVALYWAAALEGGDQALHLSRLHPEAIEDEKLRNVLRFISDRDASGDLAEDAETYGALYRVAGAELVHWLQSIRDVSGGLSVRAYAKRVWKSWKVRQVTQYASDLAASLNDLAGRDPDAALARADEGFARALALRAEALESATPQTRAAVSEAERTRTEVKGLPGISWPFEKMTRALGPIIPGQVIGLTGYPGGGKSTTGCALFGGFATQGVPQIVVPTEMRAGWLSRVYAARAGVPQQVAENGLWDHTDPETLRLVAQILRYEGPAAIHQAEAAVRQWKADYRAAIDALEGRPWEVVNTPSLTIDQVIGRVRVLRRRYEGQFVLVTIDHMHNLDYPDGETDRHVKAATKKLREFCQEDGKMAALCLFQPKKPERSAVPPEYRPVGAHEIRGQVAEVLDTHLGIYRWHVQTDPHRVTSWGTPLAVVDEHGWPVRCPPDEGGKPDDERLYLKPDKRRIGGSGPTFFLGFNPETGRVTDAVPTARVVPPVAIYRG